MRWSFAFILAVPLAVCSGAASALDLDQVQFGISLSFDQRAQPRGLALGLIDATPGPDETYRTVRFPRPVDPLLAYDVRRNDLTLSPLLQDTSLGNRLEFLGARLKRPAPATP